MWEASWIIFKFCSKSSSQNIISIFYCEFPKERCTSLQLFFTHLKFLHLWYPFSQELDCRITLIMHSCFWSLGGEKLYRETNEEYRLSGFEANHKSSTKFTSHFVEGFCIFTFPNLSIQKGKGSTKDARGKHNLNQVGFLDIT